jgi:copper chaperone CopZ
MLQTFIINGMTCVGCQYKVKHLLKEIADVTNVEVQLENKTAVIESHHKIMEDEIILALKEYPKYTIGTKVLSIENLQKKTWWQTYKPVLLIFIYLTVVCSIVEIMTPQWMLMRWMNNFMAGFFLVFSFFKLLNVNEFANSYAMYDVVALKWKTWGFIYPFVELILGLLLLLQIQPMVTNMLVLIIMAISLLGVFKTVIKKQKIKCACLGSVFNLPMSTLTIIEDGLMIAMSVYMILVML